MREDGGVDRTDRILLILTRVVIVPGFLAATYLTYTKLFHVPVMCSGGCDVVTLSKWSEVFGIPVTLIGMIAYITLMGSTFWRNENAKLLAAFVASCGAAFSIFLQYQALIVLKHLCPYCLTSAICMLLLCVISLTRVLRLPKFDFESDPSPEVETV
jgi:uncharacterized membrane protein